MTKDNIAQLRASFNKINKGKAIIWAIWIVLLLVLLPHTAWAFSQFEDLESGVPFFGLIIPGATMAWLLAIVFELSLGVFTHKLAQHVATSPPAVNWWDIPMRYLNIYGFGLFTFWALSTAANIAHSFEYATPFVIAPEGSYLFTAYKIVFGAVLPLASAMFASVLVTSDTEQQPNESEQLLHSELARLNSELSSSKKTVQQLNKTAQNLNGLSKLHSKSEQDRIAAAQSLADNLSQNAVAAIAKVHPSTVKKYNEQ